MAFEDVMGNVQRMLAGMNALAAIGAELSPTSSDTADPAFVSALAAVSAAAGVDVGALEPPQQAMVLGMIRLNFAQAQELLNDPARPPGWTYNDATVLEGMGRLSMMIPPLLATAPEFGNVTSLLDVGTGVGWLAVSAANVWPAANVVGIDVWEPSLERAQKNVSEAGFADRVILRNQDLSALDDTDAFDCAWVPTFFIADDVLTASMPKIVRALRPGGWIALGLFKAPPDPLVSATTALQTIRNGGINLEPEHASDLLNDAGCVAVRPFVPAGPAPIVFVIGQKPA